MSVTITRRKAIELGEKTIADARRIYSDVAPLRLTDESPVVIAFRQVIEHSPAFARGTDCAQEDGEEICCPMLQTVFDLVDDLMGVSCMLALTWDIVTGEDGLSPAKVIRVNPYTVMTIDQIKNFAHEAVLQHPPREVYVRVLDQSHPPIIGTLTFAGKNKFRVDTPQAALFISYDETEAVEYA